MISFWVLVFFGPKLGKPLSGWVAVGLAMGVPLVLATIVLYGWWWGEDATSRALLTEGAYRYHWADIGSVPVTVGIKLDSLTVAMFFMVTFVAFWIFVFSIGYMSGHSDEVEGKSKYSRFFAYLSLFGFSMLGLVVSSSLLFLFICWELVGLCSYLLIGFYFDRPYASAAAIKAFVTNRVGDFGFLIGLMLVYFYLGTLDLDEAAERFAQQYGAFLSDPQTAAAGIFGSSFTLFGWSLATIMGIGLFCGAMGKSAQFPLHVWLPDAMAGPTPVSALIHAATMVAAGVYLVARVFRLMTPDALMFISLIGCLTLTLMALVAIVQTDIKKLLAYSTLSQLGYMIFGLGCGAWIAALFHLITHAFFKAMLFLCSGQVIEGCHHEQDMRKMGGLRRKMPWTCWTFFVGVLAISGVGIPWTAIGLGGFFSKDEILKVAWVRSFAWDDYSKHALHGEPAQHASEAATTTPVHADGQHHSEPGAQATGWKTPRSRLGLGSGSVPPVRAGSYGKRHVRLVSDMLDREQEQDPHAAKHPDLREAAKVAIFEGMSPLPKWMFWLAIITAYVTPFYMFRAWWMTFMGQPRDQQVYEHAHESRLMYVPLIVLAVGTFAVSYWLFRDMFADAAGAATQAASVMALDGHADTEAMHLAHSRLIPIVGFAFLVGFGIAWALYRRGLESAAKAKRFLGPIHTLLEQKYFIDHVYDFVLVKGCILVAHIARLIDTWIVDLIFDTLAAATERLAAFSGLILDNHGVDGVVNGIAQTSQDIGGALRKPQTGRVRNYVLLAAGAATVAIICLAWLASRGGGELVTMAGGSAP